MEHAFFVLPLTLDATTVALYLPVINVMLASDLYFIIINVSHTLLLDFSTKQELPNLVILFVLLVLTFHMSVHLVSTSVSVIIDA